MNTIALTAALALSGAPQASHQQTMDEAVALLESFTPHSLRPQTPILNVYWPLPWPIFPEIPLPLPETHPDEYDM